ncbi:hypothetical protein [Saccharothrix sp. ST-888]|uniref:hypothetical protein n=1 Tax=Saccharothrix sp. ST-888 TaxID=1427391 RepID=UPI0005ED3879|nr:hypothetical protein [Saccharothrix sp. ST-888]KJK58478.1 hypothetical protein UK12_10090 [Saccharothrix sp. ST-888]
MSHRIRWATAIVAVLFCAASGWWYAQTGDDPRLRRAEARDSALADGRAELARLNSIDAKDSAAGLRQWLDATTGVLHDQLRSSSGADGAAVAKAGTSARGTVTDAAVTELDTRAGTARLIATVQVELTPLSGGTATGTTGTDRKRFEAGLARTPDGWKVTSLTAVPVGAS